MKMNIREATVIQKFSYPEINSDSCNTIVIPRFFKSSCTYPLV